MTGKVLAAFQRREGTQCSNTDSLGASKSGHHGRFGWDGSRDMAQSGFGNLQQAWENGKERSIESSSVESSELAAGSRNLHPPRCRGV